MIIRAVDIMLPRYVQAILVKLESNGFEAYVVGGAVRDALLHRQINDYDVTTNATPEQVMEIFSTEKVIPTGLQHGTVTVMSGMNGVEITTFRTESGYTDHRHPDEVKFATTLKDDLARRDFTINALACTKEGNVIDYFTGLEDLEKKVIRCVGDPTERFQEDSLRILRGMRFAAQLEFTIDEETSNAMTECKDLISFVSAERIRVELNKMMSADNSHCISALLYRYNDIVGTIIPELKPTFVPNLNIEHHSPIIYKHICNVVGNIEVKDYLLRLAGLFHDIAKPSTFALIDNEATFYNHDTEGATITYEILKRLKYTNEEIDEIVLLVRHHNDPSKVDPKWVRRKLNKFNGNDQRLRKLFILKLADVRDHSFFKKWQYNKFKELNQILDDIISEEQCFSLKKMAVNGVDMINIGLSGKDIGLALSFLLNSVIDDKVENQHDKLIEYLLSHRKEVFTE